MTTLTARNMDGSTGGSVVLNDRIFGAKVSPALIHQAVLAEMTNSRQDTRNTKTRGEVAGGGRKPFRQKGTGRARQGSISAPHYRHGGVVFGPHPRDLSSRMPRKARRAAIASALSARSAEDAVMILESLELEAISTKTASSLLDTLGIEGKAMIVLGAHDDIVYKSFRNIPGVIVRVAPAFSVRDILDSTQIVMVKPALAAIESKWGVDKQEGVRP